MRRPTSHTKSLANEPQTPHVSTTTGITIKLDSNRLYLELLLRSTIFAAAPALIPECHTCDDANVSGQVKFYTNALPCDHGISVTPSGRWIDEAFPSGTTHASFPTDCQCAKAEEKYPSGRPVNRLGTIFATREAVLEIDAKNANEAKLQAHRTPKLPTQTGKEASFHAASVSFILIHVDKASRKSPSYELTF